LKLQVPEALAQIVPSDLAKRYADNVRVRSLEEYFSPNFKMGTTNKH
jgi:hypothetical protein